MWALHFGWVSQGMSNEVPSSREEQALSHPLRIGRREINLSAQQSYRALIKKGFQPRSDVRPWPFKRPLDWGADPFRDRNWAFQLHAWRGIDPILAEFFHTGDKRFLWEALAFALDWQRYHQNNKPAAFSWYDMASGLRAMRIALFLEASSSGFISLSSRDEADLLALAEEHLQRLQIEKFINLGNHGIFQVCGLQLLSSVFPDRAAAAEASAFAGVMFERILRHGYSEEGVHREHSPYYHYFTTSTIRRLCAAPGMWGKAIRVLDLAETVQPWLVWPDGRFVEAGDSEGKARPLNEAPDSLISLGEGRNFAVADFTRSGYAIIRSDPRLEAQPSMLFVTGMAYSTAHKHADELSFALYEHGEPLFIDSGKYGFNRDKWRAYVTSAAAHNTISLLDRTITRSEVSGFGSFLHSLDRGPGGFRVTGSISRPGLFRQKRVIEYDPGRSLIVRDEVSSDSHQHFVSSLHLHRRLEPKLTADGFEVVLTCGKKVRAHLETANCRIESARGQEAPILGWQSTGYLKMEPATVVRAICHGSQRTITWSLDLDAS